MIFIVLQGFTADPAHHTPQGAEAPPSLGEAPGLKGHHEINVAYEKVLACGSKNGVLYEIAVFGAGCVGVCLCAHVCVCVLLTIFVVRVLRFRPRRGS